MSRSLIGALLLLWPALPALEAAEPPPQKPNIVFIMIDTLRADSVGCYGCAHKTTPHLDNLAQEGVRCTHTFAASSWTIPSLMSMFTSLSPTEHRCVSYKTKLPDAVTTLAQELKSAGYQTAGVVSNPSAGGAFGFSRGFEFYDDYTIPLGAEQNLFGDQDEAKSIRAVSTSASVNRVALAWLKDKRDVKRPFFLFLLYVDPHADYVPPAPYDRMFDPEYAGTVTGRKLYENRNQEYSAADRAHLRALYDGEVRNVDQHIGRVLKTLDEMQLSKDTLVVVTADHGEEFWEHGGQFHGHTLHDELVHVPLIVRWPGQVQAGMVAEGLNSQLGLMPTLLEAANVKIPAQCQGQSMLSAFKGGEFKPAQAVFMEIQAEGKDLRAMRSAERKVIWDAGAQQFSAFDLATDAGEKKDVFKQADWSQAMAEQLRKWDKLANESAEKLGSAQKAETDDKLLELLRQMGYAH